jgi:hypothetical protein
MAKSIDMSARMLCRIHETGGACPGLSCTRLVMAMEGVNKAWRMRRKNRSAEVTELLKIVDTSIGSYMHFLFLLSLP